MSEKTLENIAAEEQTTALDELFVVIIEALFKVILAIEAYYFSKGLTLSKKIPEFNLQLAQLLRRCFLDEVKLNPTIDWDTSTIVKEKPRLIATLGKVLGLYLMRDKQGNLRCCVRLDHNQKTTLRVNLKAVKEQQMEERRTNKENLKKTRPKETSSSVGLI